RSGESEEVLGVAANHLVLFWVRHAGEIFVDDLQRVGPVGLLMGKIGTPHQAIDVDFVAQLDADAVELKPPIKIFANVFTRRTLQRFQPEQAIGPTMMAIIAHIGALQKKWNPTDLIFGKEDTQARKTVEQS